MLPAPHTLVWLIVLATALVILRIVAWRLFLLVRPGSVRVGPVDKEPLLPEGFDALSEQLKALGFAPIGVRSEQPRLSREVVNFDFANPAARTFASVYEKGRGYFVSPLEDGALVRTEMRQAAGSPQTLSEVFEAHRARCAGRERAGRYDTSERLALARAWFSDSGAAVVRRQQVAPVLWSLLTLGMVAWALLRHS